jgi:hypothetical protein
MLRGWLDFRRGSSPLNIKTKIAMVTGYCTPYPARKNAAHFHDLGPKLGA